MSEAMTNREIAAEIAREIDAAFARGWAADQVQAGRMTLGAVAGYVS